MDHSWITQFFFSLEVLHIEYGLMPFFPQLAVQSNIVRVSCFQHSSLHFPALLHCHTLRSGDLGLVFVFVLGVYFCGFLFIFFPQRERAFSSATHPDSTFNVRVVFLFYLVKTSAFNFFFFFGAFPSSSSLLHTLVL